MTPDRDSMSEKKADPAAAPFGPVASNPRDEDAAELNAAGYAQELERSFSLPAMGCLCLCLMATWEALSTVVYDAACHLSEEIPHAARNVPLAMVGSVVVNGVIGVAYCVVLLFSISSLEDILATPTGFPFMQIYLDATKSRAGATVMSLLLIIIAATANVACVTSASRTAWAFARDKALPFDKIFCRVSRKHQVPSNAVILVTAIQALLGFIYLGNTAAFNAILSMAIIGLYLSYTLPIVYMLLYGRRRGSTHHSGPFRLAKPLGITLNVIGIMWMTLVVIFSTFPGTMPVTPENMNYSSVVMVGWLIGGFLYYVARGKKKYGVPHVSVAMVTSISIPVDVA
ncbi:hypothetical protein KJ359_007497 [Pestalotiopsis sp. 9143b]|nr:hypothetical protein KJ359_007497 [Pestalotiopsis sp. 9143b]